MQIVVVKSPPRALVLRHLLRDVAPPRVAEYLLEHARQLRRLDQLSVGGCGHTASGLRLNARRRLEGRSDVRPRAALVDHARLQSAAAHVLLLVRLPQPRLDLGREPRIVLRVQLSNVLVAEAAADHEVSVAGECLALRVVHPAG